MIYKKFGEDFKSEGGALTLASEEVTDGNEEQGVYTKAHNDGWVITGKIIEDYYVWVNSFVAYHPIYGFVCGDFEDTVYASSEEAFAHFWQHHEPEAWDYEDI